MINPDFALFDENMFARLRRLLAKTQAISGQSVINMTIGEPQQKAPDLLAQTVAEHSQSWNSYPKPAGDAEMQSDIMAYIEHRFGAGASEMLDPACHLLPIPGTREALHFLGLCIAGSKTNGCALVSNPYYHAWRAGALASRGDILYMNLTPKTGYMPDLDALDEAVLARCQIMFICTPSNPHGACASKSWLAQAVSLARAHDFLLVVDECYSDIWRGSAPIGMLQVLAELADSPNSLGDSSGDSPDSPDPMRQIVVLNSLSKRSNAAGLRCGYMAGDVRIIAAYTKLIASGGALVPTPLLRAAGKLYRDEAHPRTVRAHYDKSFELAEEILGVPAPQGGFFLWLKVRDDLEFTTRLWQEASVRVMPGRYMAADTPDGNPGAGYVRIALMHDHAIISEALRRIQPIFAAERVKSEESGQEG